MVHCCSRSNPCVSHMQVSVVDAFTPIISYSKPDKKKASQWKQRVVRKEVLQTEMQHADQCQAQPWVATCSNLFCAFCKYPRTCRFMAGAWVYVALCACLTVPSLRRTCSGDGGPVRGRVLRALRPQPQRGPPEGGGAARARVAHRLPGRAGAGGASAGVVRGGCELGWETGNVGLTR